MSRRFALVVGLCAGCQLENPEYVVVGQLEDLPRHLSPGSVVVRTETLGAQRLELAAWTLDDGAAGLVTSAAGASVFRMRADGGVASVDGAGLAQGVSLGDEVFVADCPYRARLSLTDPDAALVELGVLPVGDTVLCGGAFGPGATPDRVISLDQTLSAVTLHTIDRVAGTDTRSALTTIAPPPPDLGVTLIYEASPGVVASVWSGADGFSFVDGAGVVVPAPEVAGGPMGATAWVGEDGAVRVSTSAGLYRWDAASEAASEVEPVPPSPTGTDWVGGRGRGAAWAEAGDPNPRAPELTVPTAMAFRYATDAGFEVVEPPLTPCCDPDECRALGETYVIGGIATPGGPVVVYDFWSWFGDDAQFVHQVIVRPVDDPCPSGG